MNKLIALGVLGVLCVPSAHAFGPSKKKKRRIIAQQTRLNAEWQQRFTSFVNTDSLPTFAPRDLAETLPSLGTSSFGLELPSLSLPSPAASLRLGGLNPFGGTSFSSQLPNFDVGLPNLSSIPGINGNVSLPSSVQSTLNSGSSLFGNKKGNHTSTSLPFLDTSNAEDLTFKIEAVKIAEAALKELKTAPSGSVGGFKMMKFLYKLIKSVGSRQKGLVNSMLVLITVPYFATLAASWWMGPTTAMDITWPGAKQGITTVIEQVLKKYGRIGGMMDIQSYASQLTNLPGQLSNLPGQLSNLPGQLSNLPGQLGSQLGSLPGQLSDLPGQLGSIDSLGDLRDVGSQLRDLPGQISDLQNLPDRATNQVTRQVTGQVRGVSQLGRLAQQIPPLN